MFLLAEICRACPISLHADKKNTKSQRRFASAFFLVFFSSWATLLTREHDLWKHNRKFAHEQITNTIFPQNRSDDQDPSKPVDPPLSLGHDVQCLLSLVRRISKLIQSKGGGGAVCLWLEGCWFEPQGQLGDLP